MPAEVKEKTPVLMPDLKESTSETEKFINAQKKKNMFMEDDIKTLQDENKELKKQLDFVKKLVSDQESSSAKLSKKDSSAKTLSISALVVSIAAIVLTLVQMF